MMKRVWLLGLVLIFGLAPAASAVTSPYTIDLGYEFSGAQNPASPVLPWVTATFADTGTDEVTLTITNLNLSGSEFMSSFFFNCTFANDDITWDTLDIPPISSIMYDLNNMIEAYKADGDGYFDGVINFNTSGDRFTQGESVDVVFSGDGLDLNNFLFSDGLPLTSIGNNGGWQVAAHIQSILMDDGSTDGSGWITNGGGGGGGEVPIPASVLLLGSGLLGMLGIKRKRS